MDGGSNGKLVMRIYGGERKKRERSLGLILSKSKEAEEVDFYIVYFFSGIKKNPLYNLPSFHSIMGY